MSPTSNRRGRYETVQLSTELGTMFYWLLDIIYSGRTRSQEGENYENV